MSNKLISICSYGNVIILIALAFYFFFLPFGIIINDLSDPGLSNGAMPSFLYQQHDQLASRFESWAYARVNSNRASQLSLNNISGTEWPIFSAVYFLWTTEALQDAWNDDPTLYTTMPKEYAQGAIEAAAAIISDPNHATWVKNHWGDAYLERENLFYRMLLISGLTSYQKLLGNKQHEELLRDQTESLAREIDESPFGLLDDYPGQCYPIDILPAITAIQRADVVLGTDHSAFTARALRAFMGSRLDSTTMLPTYIADSQTGEGLGPARGVGISYMLIWAPELWPETAQSWYGRYENHFWQEGWLVTGVREFSKHQNFPEWLMDVDAGPVVAGYGTAASAFGIGAARVNGRFDQAYPLSAEALVLSWPLSNGTLLGARMLSNLSDAPFIGETVLLFNFSRQPLTDTIVKEKGGLPIIVYLALASYALFGLAITFFAIGKIKQWQRFATKQYFPKSNFQFISWLILILAAIVVIAFSKPAVGLLILLLGQLLPRSERISSPK